MDVRYTKKVDKTIAVDLNIINPIVFLTVCTRPVLKFWIHNDNQQKKKRNIKKKVSLMGEDTGRVVTIIKPPNLILGWL